MPQAQIGLIGLAVMGANLARNIARNQHSIVVFNRTISKTVEFINNFGNEYLTGAKDLAEFVSQIKRPRKIMIMVQAGQAVDMVIEQLKPWLDQDDIIIDCGNSNFHDTQRRYAELNQGGFKFIGCGVSGGEEGALNGPSLMPGGDPGTWEIIKPILTDIAAKDFQNEPCVTYIGDNGAGHYVKMVHNGIEYGVMQMMAEVYDLMRRTFDLSAPQIAEIFTQYNQGKLNSFLFEIASQVLTRQDEFQAGYLIDYILDKAGQKGTGQWTAMDALNRGIPLSTITESVFARTISSQKETRLKLNKLYHPMDFKIEFSEDLIGILENALYAGMLSSYAQGYDLITQAARAQGWQIDLAEISRIWEGGCIIRAQILNFLHQAYVNSDQKDLHLFEISEVKEALDETLPDLRQIVSLLLQSQISAPSLATALTYFDGMTSAQSAANFIQGLRDFFGAHTYERIDRKGVFHTEWGEG